MKSISLCFCLICCVSIFKAQNISGNDLLDKAIQYHDPNGNWSNFNNTLYVTMTMPNRSDRLSEIQINLPKSEFHLKATRENTTTEYMISPALCSLKLNGNSTISEEDIKTYDLTCERAEMYRNYYTYLYGLPMKLKDEGTIIHAQTERRSFKGKTYDILKASYDPDVGSDVWYFYFDPQTHAMELYQFFKTDDNGKEIPDSGEYILLTDIEIIEDIKMPKVRAWYYNKNDQYLGTDALNMN